MTTLLKVENIFKSYTQNDQKINILKDINFELAEHETLAIMGKSGSGKSTLLSLILGLNKVDQGKIFFSKKDISTSSEDELLELRRKSLGMIFQTHQLIDTLSAWENVWLNAVLRNVPNPEVESKKLLEQVELGHRINHLPSELSGGENQRVAVARALIGNPQLVLADEPNANLDTVTGNTVMDLMFRLVEERKQTLILVTHDESLAKKCRRIFHLTNSL